MASAEPRKLSDKKSGSSSSSSSSNSENEYEITTRMKGAHLYAGTMKTHNALVAQARNRQDYAKSSLFTPSKWPTGKQDVLPKKSKSMRRATYNTPGYGTSKQENNLLPMKANNVLARPGFALLSRQYAGPPPPVKAAGKRKYGTQKPIQLSYYNQKDKESRRKRLLELLKHRAAKASRKASKKKAANEQK